MIAGVLEFPAAIAGFRKKPAMTAGLLIFSAETAGFLGELSYKDEKNPPKWQIFNF